jgi:hypothetical protein
MSLAPITRVALLEDAIRLARRAHRVEPALLACLTDSAHMARVGVVGRLNVGWLQPGLLRERERWGVPARLPEAHRGLVVGATTAADRVAFLLGGMVQTAFLRTLATVDPMALDAAVVHGLLLSGHAAAFEAFLAGAGYANREEALAVLWRDMLHRALAESHTMMPDMVHATAWLDRMYATYAAWAQDSLALGQALNTGTSMLIDGLPLFHERDAVERAVRSLRRAAEVPTEEAQLALAEPAHSAWGLAVRHAASELETASRLWHDAGTSHMTRDAA